MDLDGTWRMMQNDQLYDRDALPGLVIAGDAARWVNAADDALGSVAGNGRNLTISFPPQAVDDVDGKGLAWERLTIVFDDEDEADGAMSAQLEQGRGEIGGAAPWGVRSASGDVWSYSDPVTLVRENGPAERHFQRIAATPEPGDLPY